RPGRPGGRWGGGDGADRAGGGLGGVGAPRPRLEARDVAALLVDRDQKVVALCAQVGRQIAELLAALDVPRIENDTTQTLGDAAADPGGHGRPFEARETAGRAGRREP